MRDTRDLKAGEMTIDELTFELRRVRTRKGKGLEHVPGGWKRRFKDRESEVAQELLGRTRVAEVER